MHERKLPLLLWFCTFPISGLTKVVGSCFTIPWPRHTPWANVLPLASLMSVPSAAHEKCRKVSLSHKASAIAIPVSSPTRVFWQLKCRPDEISGRLFFCTPETQNCFGVYLKQNSAEGGDDSSLLAQILFILWHSEANLDKTLAREEFWGSASASSFPVLSCRFELSAFKEKDRREEFCFRTSATALPTSPEVPQCCTCKVKCFLIWKASQD